MAQNNKHKWDFQNIGGTTRVNIHTGEDIKHLAELDQKMWTVLSCPISGLEIDSKSLQYTDADADGKIHVNDVISTANWLCKVLKDPDTLFHNKGKLALDGINQKTEEGLHIYQSAKQIAENLNKEDGILTLQDTQDSMAIFAKTKFNGDGVITENTTDDAALKEIINSIVSITGGSLDRSGVQGVNTEQINSFYADLQAYIDWREQVVALPYGEKTDEVLSAYQALDAKVKDFFVRCKLAAFSDSATALDVQVSRIEAISREDLTQQTAEIASYPIARISAKAEINLSYPINPAWAEPFEVIRSVVFAPDTKVITEEEWNAIGEKLAPYIAWLNAKQGNSVEALGEETIKALLKDNRQTTLLELVEKDIALADEANNINQVDKLLHLYKDFATILHNFVTLQDFYSRDKDTLAIFQVGTLVIDQRACHLCMRVTDMSKHDAQAAASGMFLIYCNCTLQSTGEKMQIVAAMTIGDIRNLKVGKNALFYDRQGRDWDAEVVKIIDNPISIGQAFWSPYRKFCDWVINLINKSAANKESKVFANVTQKVESSTADTTTLANQKKKDSFDIAKFAGIFAAIGMAIGYIGSFLTSLGQGVKGLVAVGLWAPLAALLGLMLIISGPSMIIAWFKLRKRNIAPLLNANGWAVNASSTISILFGATLTDAAKFPKLKLQDPYAKKGMPKWKRVCLSVATIVIVVVALWLCNLLAWAKLPSPLFHHDEAVAEEVVIPDDTAAETDAIVIEETVTE